MSVAVDRDQTIRRWRELLAVEMEKHHRSKPSRTWAYRHALSYVDGFDVHPAVVVMAASAINVAVSTLESVRSQR